MDVCLVSMPFAHLGSPSIALGLLQSILERRQMQCKSVYANFWFADTIGLPAYIGVCDTLIEDVLGEWVFGKAAFPDYDPKPKRYVAGLKARTDWIRQIDDAELLRGLHEMREIADEFTDRAAESIIDMKPRIVGCTSMFRQHVASLALLRRIREKAPNVITMLGGANCETVMGRTTHKCFEWVDYVVSGEADDFVVDLCRTLIDSKRTLTADELPWGVFGPIHRTVGYPTSMQDGGEEAPRAISTSVADLPIPNYDDYFAALNQSPFRQQIHPRLLHESSRGCWWGEKKHCVFCGLNGTTMNYRSKPAEKVVQELEQLSTRYGVHEFQFADNIFNTEYFDTLLPQLAKSDRRYEICHEIKPNLNRDQIQQLQAAGYTQLLLGIESLHTEHLKLMKKGCQAWQNLQTLKWCREFGVWASWNMLYDFPGEDDRWFVEIAQWLPLIAHLKPPTWQFLVKVRYDRYSPMQVRPDEFGLKLKPYDLYRYVYPLSEIDLIDQTYYFQEESEDVSATSDHGLPAIDRPGARQVQKILHDWYTRFFSGACPVLSMQIEHESLKLFDSRPCAVEKRAVLEGPEREILLHADSAVPRHYIEQTMIREHGCSPAVIGRAIDSLIDRRWMIEIDDRLISPGRTISDRKPAFHSRDPRRIRQFPRQDADTLPDDA